jgi:hypothetical protein
LEPEEITGNLAAALNTVEKALRENGGAVARALIITRLCSHESLPYTTLAAEVAKTTPRDASLALIGQHLLALPSLNLLPVAVERSISLVEGINDGSLTADEFLLAAWQAMRTLDVSQRADFLASLSRRD